VRPARFVAALLAAAALCCAPALVRPTKADGERAAARWPGSGLAELEQGRAIFVAKCGRCHELVLPEDLPAAEWPQQLGKMAGKAKLSAGQRELVERYLVTLAERTAEKQ
jgi:cytochrome c5